MGDIILTDGSRELIQPGPDQLVINLTAKNALAINDDRDWLRARVLLGALFQKHGKFLVEVTKLGV